MNLHWAVRFNGATQTGCFESFTESLSSKGFYCRCVERFAPGVAMECVLTIPSFDGADAQGQLHCHVRVKKVDVTGLLFGTEFEIEDYTLRQRRLAETSD